MSYTVERVPPAAPLVKAADHASDHERGKRDQQGRDEPAAAENVPGSEDPAVVVEHSHYSDMVTLGGVAAYQAAARRALDLRAREPGTGSDAAPEDGPTDEA